MGYDMRYVNEHPAIAERVAEKRAIADKAVAIREQYQRGTPEYTEAQEAVMTAFNEASDADTSYFRLNVWGMGHMRDTMHEAGMLITDYDDQSGPWPEMTDWDGYYEREEAGTPSAPDVAYNDQVTAKLAWSVGDTPGIPAHKFSSNDGWIVTPAECRSAVGIWQNLNDATKARLRVEWQEDNGSNYLDQWITYLTGAVKSGGFEVY